MLPVSAQLPTLPPAASQHWSMEGLVALYRTDSVLGEWDSSPVVQCLSARGLESSPTGGHEGLDSCHHSLPWPLRAGSGGEELETGPFLSSGRTFMGI